MSKQARAWCFTLNNPEGESELPKFGDYMIYGREVGESGTPHHQGYIECRHPKTLESMKKWLPGAHFERRRGSQAQAIEYCKKDGDWTEYGEPKQQGKRNDLASYKDMVETGASNDELRESYPEIDSKCLRWKEEIRNDMFEARNKRRNLGKQVIVRYGGSGVGKTRSVWDAHEDEGLYVLSVTKNRPLWFDGYKGERFVLIDEYDGEIEYRKFLQLLDIYPMRVEKKGGSFTFNCDIIYITSNKSPGEWYPHVSHEDLKPLVRRITSLELWYPEGFHIEEITKQTEAHEGRT